MCVNNLSKVALDSAAAGIEPAISSRKSNALTATPPSHAVCREWTEQQAIVGYDSRPLIDHRAPLPVIQKASLARTIRPTTSLCSPIRSITFTDALCVAARLLP